MGSGRLAIAIAVFGTALALPAGLAAQEPVAPGDAEQPVLSEPAQEPIAPGDPEQPVLSEPAYEPAPEEAPPAAAEDGAAEQPLRASARQAARASTTQVTMIDYEFKPSSVEVDVGDTVTWNNDGPDEPHTATADDGSFDTGEVAVGQSASVTLDEPGSFSYICSIHPSMSGTLRVLAVEDDSGPSGGPGGNGDGTGGTGPDPTSTPDPTGTPGPSPAESSRRLPSTGQDGLPLFVAGIALLVAGLLAGALSVATKPALGPVELADRRPEVGPE